MANIIRGGSALYTGSIRKGEYMDSSAYATTKTYDLDFSTYLGASSLNIGSMCVFFTVRHNTIDNGIIHIKLEVQNTSGTWTTLRDNDITNNINYNNGNASMRFYNYTQNFTRDDYQAFRITLSKAESNTENGNIFSFYTCISVV